MSDVFLREFQKESTHADRARYVTLKQTLAPLADLFRDRRVLDYGASHGVSLFALLELGAAEVVGVEIEEARVTEGLEILAASEYVHRADLLHTPDTTALPFEDGAFDVVLCNAVLEHIPQPRGAYIREMWRVLAPGGVLIVNETPNKYLPADFHTLHLPLPTHWLPSRLAHRIGVALGRFGAHRTDWASSGWRGLGFYELVAPIEGWELIPERANARHRALSALGLPASLLDPYPCWLLRKR